MLALWFDYPGAFNVLVAILGQIAAFVPLTITLRECWKADHAPSNRGPSAGTFLVPVRESYSLQPTAHSRNNGGLPDGIMITTDQQSDGTVRPLPGLIITDTRLLITDMTAQESGDVRE